MKNGEVAIIVLHTYLAGGIVTSIIKDEWLFFIAFLFAGLANVYYLLKE